MPPSRADRRRASRGAGPAGDEQGLGAGRLAGADSTPRGRDLLPAVPVKSQEACRLGGEQTKEAHLFKCG